MDATYFEDRLNISVNLMNAATDPGARMAHKGMADRYRALVVEQRTRLPRIRPEALPASYSISDALAGWADDGGPCWEPRR